MLDVDELVFSPPELGGILYLPGPSGSGSKIYDRSPYGNIGTITGATWTRLPSGLWCLSFDGVDDKVQTASAPVSDYPFTLASWCNHIGGDRTIISLARSDRTDTWWYISIISTGEASCQAKNTSSIDILSSVLDAGWHFIAGVFASATNRELFVDGVSAGTSTTSVAYNSTNMRCWVGGLGDQTPQYLNAYIALPRIYNYARSALQVQNDFNREKYLFGVW